MNIDVGSTFTCEWVDEEGNHCSLTYEVLAVQTAPTTVLTTKLV